MPTMLTDEEVRSALECLTWRWGRGDVTELIRWPHDFCGYFRVRKQYGVEEHRWREVGRTVFAWGHQVTLKDDGTWAPLR